MASLVRPIASLILCGVFAVGQIPVWMHAHHCHLSHSPVAVGLERSLDCKQVDGEVSRSAENSHWNCDDHPAPNAATRIRSTNICRDGCCHHIPSSRLSVAPDLAAEQPGDDPSECDQGGGEDPSHHDSDHCLLCTSLWVQIGEVPLEFTLAVQPQVVWLAPSVAANIPSAASPSTLHLRGPPASA